MSGLTAKERFIRSLEGKEVDKVPVCSVTQTGVVELMEITGSKWPQAHYDPEMMATLAIAGNTIAGLEAVRFPFCNTVIPETLGCIFNEGSIDTQPYQLDFPCKTKEDAANFSIPADLAKSRRIEIMLKTAEIIKDRISDDIPLVAGMIGPASIAFYLSGAKNYLHWCITDPELLKRLMKLGTEICIEYSNLLFERGVDAVVIIDSEAGPDLLPPPLFTELVLPEYHLLTSEMKGHKILHICGDATDILDPMANSGFEGLSIEERTDLSYAKSIVGDRACLIGNLSPAATLLSKSTDQIKKEAKQCIEDGAGILAPGCGIAPRTPVENIKAFVASRDEYYKEQG
ncbi:MAG: [methyl-Co(III) methanol/glycine betaine-specific corrinoid protein]:coenzyme methyltransferase [Methanolobus sp.]|jgi:[methyl-Co(III) methanol-specific corrinoid protein]:coenzyme M methyltransferase|uniref:Methyltransferase, MtaA/CmuA family n=1 Tax=Methanolobus tindarius DSM 2278 TaxID=1090322 RepID=W9E0A5_METTI|nr:MULTISPECIES: methylcobamide:CoM methyltransferase MtaA [Methanolobus]ETA69387.1 methyltransferase, MtaA/CmuA family [Methanolobus tindarius DSM 2278]MDI3486067.1 [methyl-Co(III) methanol/glycine betaine-specific corrinoid protein]:coenzyme methyltransferase [Methanolobus sp.]MDK2830346.1 [methyl-Co(III) methanol/glycine betaine-specific corrinoid protein]:coenzyme methyltransferase [Methanolobus sp.]MDK2939139.1 [methyl-Co(III) methanol/glycine betaine-specific corrinoid protein]:coenzyme m